MTAMKTAMPGIPYEFRCLSGCGTFTTRVSSAAPSERRQVNTCPTCGGSALRVWGVAGVYRPSHSSRQSKGPRRSEDRRGPDG